MRGGPGSCRSSATFGHKPPPVRTPRREIGERHVEGRSRALFVVSTEGRQPKVRPVPHHTQWFQGSPRAPQPPHLCSTTAPSAPERMTASPSVPLPVADWCGGCGRGCRAFAIQQRGRRGAASHRGSSRSQPPGRPDTTALTASMPSATPSNRIDRFACGAEKRARLRDQCTAPPVEGFIYATVSPAPR